MLRGKKSKKRRYRLLRGRGFLFAFCFILFTSLDKKTREKSMKKILSKALKKVIKGAMYIMMEKLPRQKGNKYKGLKQEHNRVGSRIIKMPSVAETEYRRR